MRMIDNSIYYKCLYCYIFLKKEIFNLSLSIYLLKLMTPSLIVHSKIFMYGPFDLKVALIMWLWARLKKLWWREIAWKSKTHANSSKKLLGHALLYTNLMLRQNRIVTFFSLRLSHMLTCMSLSQKSPPTKAYQSKSLILYRKAYGKRKLINKEH